GAATDRGGTIDCRDRAPAHFARAERRRRARLRPLSVVHAVGAGGNPPQAAVRGGTGAGDGLGLLRPSRVGPSPAVRPGGSGGAGRVDRLDQRRDRPPAATPPGTAGMSLPGDRPVLLLATTNPGKLREIRALLEGVPFDVRSLEGWPDIPAPEETGTTFEANAL